jgi:hypothetical protein
MRHVLAVLAVAGAVVAVSAKWIPPRSIEIDRVVAMAEGSHRAAKSWTPQLQKEFRRHAWDAWESCARRAPRYGVAPAALFRVYASVAFVEARWRVVVSHDQGDGWGTIGIQEAAVMAAAKRLGILGKKAPPAARAKLWDRFHRDPSFVVLIGVDHVGWIVSGRVDILPGLVKHNCYRCDELASRAERYGGSVLYWYRLLWRENLPFALASPTPSG